MAFKKRRLRKRQTPGSTGIKGALKRLGNSLTGPTAKKVATAATNAAANYIVNKYTNNQPTKTVTKTVRVKHENMNGGGNVVCTHINIGTTSAAEKKLNKSYKKNGAYAQSSYNTTFSIVNSSTTGDLQTVTDINSHFKGSSIKLLTDNAFQQNAVWQSLRPGINTAGSEADVRIEYAKACYEFTNMEPSITFVDMYILRAKVDNDTGATYDSPSTTWTSSVNQLKGLNTIATTFPGLEPGGPFFKQNFKEIVKIPICMNPGEVRRLYCYFHINKSINYSKLITKVGNLKGLTYHVMFVTRGSPCDNSNTQFATPSEIYLSPIKVVGICQATYGVSIRVRPSRGAYTAASGLTATYGANVYTLKDEDATQADLRTAGIVG